MIDDMAQLLTRHYYNCTDNNRAAGEEVFSFGITRVYDNE